MAGDHCPQCGQIKKRDTNGSQGCCNLACQYNLLDSCPYCDLISFVMGDAPLLFECPNHHIWSYHDDCCQLNTLCPSQFIGWIDSHPENIESSDESSNSDISDQFPSNSSENLLELIEKHRSFIRTTPRDIDYSDGSMFVWQCVNCHQKYLNSMCG